MGSRQIEEAAAARSDEGLNYREITGGLIQTRNEIRSRKPQPEVVVKLDIDDDDEKVIKELLGTPGLEFKITAVNSPDGVCIALHIRRKQQPTT